jgi:hypothetical protein
MDRLQLTGINAELRESAPAFILPTLPFPPSLTTNPDSHKRARPRRVPSDIRVLLAMQLTEERAGRCAGMADLRSAGYAACAIDEQIC